MSDAPARLYRAEWIDGHHMAHRNIWSGPSTEYIRAAIPAARIAELERQLAEARDQALEEAAQMIEGTAYTSNGDRRELEPVSASLVGMDMHHATIAATIRAMKGDKP